MLIFLVFILAALLVWAAVAFNLLIRDRNRVAQAWSDVDVQLLRRHDLIPRLVEMVKGYAGYERAVKVLSCANEVSGYREIRYPKMEQAILQADQILSGRDVVPAHKTVSVSKQFSKV